MSRALVFALLLAACGGREEIYNACESADDCTVPDGATAECLDKSGEGFCSWECTDDSECDESPDDYSYVCASFESEEGQHCFPSCEDSDSGEGVCPDGYGCRSTGGGSENRKICFPEG